MGGAQEARRQPVGIQGGSLGLSVPGFVGREREFAALRRAMVRPPAVVLVEGEAGIGKSRLLQESLATRRPAALVAVCPPVRESLTLGPVVDTVREARRGVAGLALSPLAGALRPLFPEWAGDLPPAPDPLDDPAASRHRLLSALAELIECLGTRVLVVEDAHWADQATLDFLLLLASRRRARPLSLVVTYRPEDVAEGSSLRWLSSRPPAGTTLVRLALDPLPVAETARLASSMLDGGPVSSELSAFLHGQTDGVPLLVEESVRLLHHRADLVRRGERWVRRRREEMRVPPTVRDAVQQRLDRLGATVRRVVRSVSVLTEPVEESVVGELAGLDPEPAAGELTAALASGLLGEDDRQRVSFRHELVRMAVYETIPGPERRRLHLAAGRALERADPPPVAQLTRHFREAGETAAWVSYAEQAAGHAVASGDHATGARLLNDVLSTARLPADTRARLATRLAHATLFRREAVDDLNRDVVRTLRAVIDSPELERPARASLRSPLGRLLMQLGDCEAGYRELELAAADLGHDPVEAATVMTYLGFPFIGSRPAATHRRWLHRAADLARSVRSPADRVRLTADQATALLCLGEEDGWRLAATLPATHPAREVRRRLARAHGNLAAAGVQWGRYQYASRQLALGRMLAEVDGSEPLRYGLRYLQAELDWLSGEWAGLADRLAELLDPEEGTPPAYAAVLCRAGWLGAACGLPAQAEDHFRRALDLAQPQGWTDDVLQAAAGLGRLWLLEGRVEDALRVTEEPIQTVARKGVWLLASEIAPVRMEALVTAGRADEAHRLVNRFARGLPGRAAPAGWASLATCRAVLAGHRTGPGGGAVAFARAARVWEELPYPYRALLARERQAASLLATGRVEAGLALLTEVGAGLDALGASGDAERVTRALRGHGLRVPRPWRRGRQGYGQHLSPRELEVVRLVTAGRTNRQIAEQLSRSPYTVATQLKSAMRKLGVSSRTALAVAAVEARVVPDR